MEIKLIRKTNGDTFTEGNLYVNSKFECYTVEDTDRHLEDGINKKIYGQTAIPRGKYPVTITESTRFKKKLISIGNVEGFTGIRIHTGNSSLDTDGCIVVGAINKDGEDDWVSHSRVAYKSLHGRVQVALDRDEEVTLEIL